LTFKISTNIPTFANNQFFSQFLYEKLIRQLEQSGIFQVMFKHATIGILMVKSSGEILMANGFAERLFGYEADELNGQKVEILVPNALRRGHAKHRENYHKKPVERTMGAGLDLNGKRKDGTTFPIEISLGHTEFDGEKMAIAYINDVTKQKEAAAALQNEKNTAQMYLDIAGSMVVVIDKEEHISLLNQRGEEILEVAEQEVIGKSWFDLFVPADERETVRGVFDRLMNEKETNVEYYENWIITKSGNRRLIWWHNRVLLDEKGEAQGTVSSGVDITEQRKAQLLNEDISKIVEDSLNEIFIFEATSLKFVLVNQGGRQNVGYTQEELNEMTPLDIKPNYTKDSFLKLVQPLVNQEKNKVIFESIHQRKDNTTYPVEIHLQYASFDNQPVFVAIISDITERKEQEQKIVEYSLHLEQKVKERTAALEESQIKLTDAQAIAKIGHWDWLAQEKKLILSKGMYQILDFEEGKDYTYEQFSSCFHPDDAQLIQDRIEEARLQKKGNSTDFRIITPQNNLKILHSNLQKPVFNEKGELIRMFGVMKDVTAQKEAEILLKESLKKEQELGELKSRFVSMASHEFRTPLSSILSSAELIQMYVEANKLEKIEKNTNRIKSSVRNLIGILNDFLSLEKLEAGKLNVVAKELNLTEFVEELQEEIKPILHIGQQLIAQHETLVVQTDPYLLKNILLNLLSNAIKYSPNAEDVNLTFNHENGQLIIKVIDKGIGIPEEDKTHMFTRFFRASNVETIKGTGLGLTIVKRYLELMQGTIEFESEFGKGSTFLIRLPHHLSQK